MEIANIKIVASEDFTELERIQIGLQSMVLTLEGTLPGNRSFGITRECLSMSPPDAAITELSIEVAEKAAEYFPDIQVKSVTGDTDGTGSLSITITIEGRE